MLSEVSYWLFEGCEQKINFIQSLMDNRQIGSFQFDKVVKWMRWILHMPHHLFPVCTHLPQHPCVASFNNIHPSTWQLLSFPGLMTSCPLLFHWLCMWKAARKFQVTFTWNPRLSTHNSCLIMAPGLQASMVSCFTTAETAFSPNYC